MATQGLLTLLGSYNQTEFKIVTGCDGGSNMETLGRALLKEDSKQFTAKFLRDFALQYCGCEECLFVVDKDGICPQSEDDLGLYRSTFECPYFNPRWGYGSADQIWLMRHDQQKLMPWLDSVWSLFDNSTFGVIGNTMRTTSGLTFDLMNPTKAMLKIGDIAHALARVTRFGGHINAEHYSVAEHSINCWKRAESKGADVEEQLAVLMHDSAEAFCGDLIKPAKVLLPMYSYMEERIEAAIADKWSIDFEAHRDLIKICDHEMLVAEKNALITNPQSFGFKGEDRVEAFPFSPATMPPSKAAQAFQRIFRGLLADRRRFKAMAQS